MFKPVFFLILIINILMNLSLCMSYDNDDRVRVWEKVETNGVNHKLYQFLNYHDITNCYQFLEDSFLLRLRCYSHYELYDVDIYIYRRNPVNVNFTASHNHYSVTATM